MAHNALMALGLGALLRILFLLHHPRFGGDSFVYGDLAQNMLLHHVYGFTDDVIRPTLIRLPGYPAFLALCFALFGRANYLAVIWVQAAIDLAGCWLLSRVAGRLGGERAGLVTLWLAALCPFTANYTAAALTETLSIYAVIVNIYAFHALLLLRFKPFWSVFYALLTGVSLAVSVLLRPDQGLLAAAVLPALLWYGLRGSGEWKVWVRPSRWVPLVLASTVVVLALGLWGVRNWRVFHVVQPLAPRYANDPGEANPYGFQRWYRTWAIDYESTLQVYWNYDGSPINANDLPARAFDSPQQRAETMTLLARYNEETTATPELDQAFAALAAERVAQHPLRYYGVLPAARVLNMWLRPRTELLRLPVKWWGFRAHPWQSVLAGAFGLVNVGYLLLAACGLVVWRRARWSGCPELAGAMVAFVVLRTVLLLTLDNSEPRYTLECYPVVILLAGMAVAGMGGNANAVETRNGFR